ncbi:MAG: TonB-dependent receptor [Treponema sp.]|jgi:hypothetical protein|nr:TonB-dependent receptor [Treponema sp.]
MRFLRPLRSALQGTLRVIISLVIFFLPLLSLAGRELTVTVEDADLGIPLEGAVVRGPNGREFTCDADGRAVIEIPDSGPATVQAAYPGYETRRVSVPEGSARITLGLHLGGVMENEELVLEAERPGTSETQSGRSVAISGEDLSRTAEIGIVEDVMTSIKLLPGVGYSGMFNAMPSIRGGDPGDLMAALDGFYLERPYYWGGSISIFDPKMVESAKLSHGVFSARYGHTISGLLEITSKQPSPTETELEFSLATSTASLNLSIPLGGKGGILVMGRITYWDTLVWAAQGLANLFPENEILAAIHSVSTAPFIRSGAIAAQYRFTPNLELTANAFFGSDGVGVWYQTAYDDEELKGSIGVGGDYLNLQGFLTSTLSYSPLPSLMLGLTLGAGFIQSNADGGLDNQITAHYSQDFIDFMLDYSGISFLFNPGDTYDTPDESAQVLHENTIMNIQGRFDLDWDLGAGFFFAAGLQELYSQWRQHEFIDMLMETRLSTILPGLPEMAQWLLGPIAAVPGASAIWPFAYEIEVSNQGLTSSAYALLEYTSPDRVFGAELGLRLDHLYFMGKDFTIQTAPVFNPRLNLDFVILKNLGIIDSLTATVGTGLFSSMNDVVSFIEARNGIDDFELKPNRSWTSIAGLKLDLSWGISFSIEAYYKEVFDRGYLVTSLAGGTGNAGYFFDGRGKVFGFDLQLQKLSSRYFDGWISYSFTHVRYHDPQSGNTNGAVLGGIYGEDIWYWPSFHRFHNINIVLNIKPIPQISIAVRLGFASGQVQSIPGTEVVPYPVILLDDNMSPVIEGGKIKILQKYRRSASTYDDNNRGPWSIPLDVKFSFYLFDAKGRVQTEIYLGAENLMSLFYNPPGSTRYNEYTGREDPGSSTASYGLPIPMISFGFKWSY